MQSLAQLLDFVKLERETGGISWTFWFKYLGLMLLLKAPQKCICSYVTQRLLSLYHSGLTWNVLTCLQTKAGATLCCFVLYAILLSIQSIHPHPPNIWNLVKTQSKNFWATPPFSCISGNWQKGEGLRLSKFLQVLWNRTVPAVSIVKGKAVKWVRTFFHATEFGETTLTSSTPILGKALVSVLSSVANMELLICVRKFFG